MKKIISALIVVAMLLMLLPTSVSYAEQLPCQTKYKVRTGDTLAIVSKMFKAQPWDIIKANNRYMQRPNYPFYRDEILCIPNPTGSTKAVSQSVLQAPAAEYNAVWKNGVLTIGAGGFALNSNWWVKVNGVKIGKILITSKNYKTFSFRVRTKPSSLQLKNMITDAVLFTGVK